MKSAQAPSTTSSLNSSSLMTIPAFHVGVITFILSIGLWLLSWWLTGRVTAWPRYPDDAYYYFQVAENFAAGFGMSMDRIEITNGFHPLWMTLLVPIYWLTNDPLTTAFIVIHTLNALLIGLSAYFLYKICLKLANPTIALVCVLLLFFSRYFVVLMNGLESGLCVTLLFAAYYWLISRPPSPDAPIFGHSALFGLILSLLMLSRLDTAFILVACGTIVLMSGLCRDTSKSFGSRLGTTISHGVQLFWPVLLLVVPYLVLNKLTFGNFTPISGTLKSAFPEVRFNGYLFLKHWEYAALFIPIVFALVTMNRKQNPHLFYFLLAAFTGHLIHWLYTLLFVKWAPFIWHFASYLPSGLVAIGLCLHWAHQKLSTQSQHYFRFLPPFVALGIGLILLKSIYPLNPGFNKTDRNWDFVAAAEEAGTWVSAHMPETATFGMKDSGTFSYFSRRQVMNLDGLINNFDYQEKLCHGQLANHLAQSGIQYIVQHQVPQHVVDQHYDVYHQVYHCRLKGGQDASLALYAEDEVYRGSHYDDAGIDTQLVIWRFDIDKQ